MNLAYVKERYSYYTGKTSDIARQLAFAGIAVIWVFKNDSGDQLRVPRELLPSAVVLIIVLALDFLQYVSGSLLWGGFMKVKESSGVKKDDEFSAPRAINWPALTFFWLKVVAIAVSYAFLLCFLFKRMWS